MSEPQTKSKCNDDECKVCDNTECPVSPKHVRREPSILKFMWHHSIFTLKGIFFSIIAAVSNVYLVLTATWGIPYSGLLYNEMQRIYFDKVKEKDLPYFKVPGFMLQEAYGAIKTKNKHIRKEMLSNIYSNNGGFVLFYLTWMLTPFHYMHKSTDEQVKFSKETMEWNVKFNGKYETEDGKVNIEEMSKVSMQIMGLYNETFIKGENDE